MSHRPQTVLLVDDDAAVRSSLKFLLEMEGFNVRLYDRAAAVLADGNLPPEGCLVVDLRMPGMDGVELVDALRARGVCYPAILIVSERATAKLTERAGRSGIGKILEKPLADGALVDSIRRAFAPGA